MRATEIHVTREGAALVMRARRKVLRGKVRMGSPLSVDMSGGKMVVDDVRTWYEDLVPPPKARA